MRWSIKAILLVIAVVLFLLSVVTDANRRDLFTIGMMFFAGAFLAEELGLGGRRIIR